LILLLMLFIAVLDFTVGSFVHTDPGELSLFFSIVLLSLFNECHASFKTLLCPQCVLSKSVSNIIYKVP